MQVLIEKKLLLNVITHRVLLDCLQLATPAQRDDLVDSLKEELVAILHTWEGAQVAVQVVAAATAKQRKAILKVCQSMQTWLTPIRSPLKRSL